ncbi:hypothetical protein COZ14_03060 [Candidatus Dojkabacteria bacterium CG_4_10_14_3_um_filter_Dojkabacteria_WS6_41_9]|nr:MAG: hypothetical protein COZ14_03060 [Candidatus Dojkabacteria bacterium CG_4_10_14_3_um_filter_Dojkabacteria_WS6_41_9]
MERYLGCRRSIGVVVNAIIADQDRKLVTKGVTRMMMTLNLAVVMILPAMVTVRIRVIATLAVETVTIFVLLYVCVPKLNVLQMIGISSKCVQHQKELTKAV